MRKIYCCLDTETVGGINSPELAYHLAGPIFTRDGGILATFNYIVAELFDEIAKDDYAKANFGRYKEMIENGECSVVPTVDDAVNAIDALCNHYGVTTIMAFNSGFDLGRGACAPLIRQEKGREFIDLYLMALQTIVQKKSYIDFCRAHGLKSRSGKTVASSVEAVYAFLTDNPEFREEHTAFSDAKQEMEIFFACLATHKKFTRNCHTYDYPGRLRLFPRMKEPEKKKKAKKKKKG